jgi:hypothetical protein
MNHSRVTHYFISVEGTGYGLVNRGFIRGRETTSHCVTTSGPDLEPSKPLTN